MKKIFSTFLIALLSVTMFATNSYWFVGGPYGWGAPEAMNVSEKGYYEYLQLDQQEGTIEFKIQLESGVWTGALGRDNTTPGYAGTDLTNMNYPGNDWGTDNAAIYYVDGPFYVIVFKPNTDINDSGNPIICASTTLPSEVDLLPTYTIAGTASFFGTVWDPANTDNDMELVDGLYTKTYNNVEMSSAIAFKVVKDHDWANGNWGKGEDWKDNYELEVDKAGTYNVTITFNASTKDITATATLIKEKKILPIIHLGSEWDKVGDDWKYGAAFTPAEDSITASLVVHFDTPDVTYGFKVVVNDDWRSLYGSDGLYTFHRDHTGAKGFISIDPALNIKIDKAGDYTFVWTYENDSLGIIYPEWGNSVVRLSMAKDITLDVKNAGTPVADGSVIKERTVLNISTSSKDAVYKPYNLRAYKTGDETTTVEIDDEGNMVMPEFPITIAVDRAEKTISLLGLDGWDLEDAIPMVVNAAAGTATYTLNAATPWDYYFGMLVDGTWQSISGAYGNYEFYRGHREASDINNPSAESMKLHVDKAGEYTFTWTFAEDKLAISFPDLNTSKVTIAENPAHAWLEVRDENDALLSNGAMIEELSELKITSAVTNDAYKMNVRAYYTENPETEVTIENGKLTMPGCPITIEATEALRTVAVHGSWNDYASDLDLTVNIETEKATGKLTLTEAEDVYFKIVEDGIYLSLPGAQGDEYRLHRGYPAAGESLSAENAYNIKLEADMAGEYIFTWTFENKKLAITFPDNTTTTIDNTNAEATAVKVLRDGQLLIIKGDKTYNVVGQIR